MPQTARTLITNAMRRCGILAEGESPTAAQAADALSTLNEMLHGFTTDGIAYAHTDLTLNSTMNFPDEQLAPVRDLFCVELMPEYGIQNDMLISRAAKWRQFMQAAYNVTPLAKVDSALRPWRWWNYETGEYE